MIPSQSPIQAPSSEILIKCKTERTEDPLCSLQFRMVAPNTAACQTIVLLSNRLRQLIVGQLMQEPSDAMPLKLGSPGISDQDSAVVGFDAAVQPTVKAGGEGLVIEHVAQQDQVKALWIRTNHVVGQANRRVHTVQLTVHPGCSGCNCDTNRRIWYFSLLQLLIMLD